MQSETVQTPASFPVLPFRAASLAAPECPQDGTRFGVRTLFLSDLHLGSCGARTDDLARLLARVDCRTLYLVGDIIDMWKLRRRWRWCDGCDRVVGRILEMARSGTEVVFVPGNHDDAARRYVGLEVGGVKIRLQDVHRTVDGRSLLITHGDQYDLVVQHSKLLCLLGDVAYTGLIRLNRAYNRVRRMFGRPYWSLSHYIKLKVKTACTFISRFEETLASEARKRGCDGVVCGHIHKAEASDFGGVAYYNCGDWVESCSLLCEHDDGALQIVDGLKLLRELAESDAESVAGQMHDRVA